MLKNPKTKIMYMEPLKFYINAKHINKKSKDNLFHNK